VQPAAQARFGAQEQAAPALAGLSLVVVAYLVKAKSEVGSLAIGTPEMRYKGSIPKNGVNKLKLIVEAREKAIAQAVKIQSSLSPEGQVYFDDDYYYYSGETELTSATA